MQPQWSPLLSKALQGSSQPSGAVHQWVKAVAKLFQRAAEVFCTLHQDGEMHLLQAHLPGEGEGPAVTDPAPSGWWGQGLGILRVWVRVCFVAAF